MKKIPLHWRILLGMVAGIIAGFIAVRLDGGWFVHDWIDPFGVIFINLLKMVAIPLIITSLLTGITDLQDISRLSRMGTRTLILFLVTTMISIVIGLVIVNIVQPGYSIDPDTRDDLLENYAGDAGSRIETAMAQKEQGPLQPLIDLIPENIFLSASGNGNMLQIIFVVILFALALMLIDHQKSEPVIRVITGLNEAILRLIQMIMWTAPFGVFALMASLVVEAPGTDLFMALMWYGFSVLAGLAVLILILYPAMVKIFAGYGYRRFFRGISPAQLLGFSTSSSVATLPLTMERTIEHLGVDEEVASFVLPIGATINMNGTSLMQAVAAVFIAQALNIDLTFGDQITIVITATLASFGTAAVPGAGLVMIVIVLNAIGVPEAGLALIFAVDRPLDMSRTIANITDDVVIAMMVAKPMGKLRK